ncbi:MAG TPA: gliding motility-associated C-terminal domain-containing protein, partial [Ferruginibacter sp.]|nr:gliding motility-associated C-terminal domain-containing protein [Ferruginibacter sp.]
FYVYNVYGQLVFSSSDFTKGWDGTINGKRSDGGTYTWVLKAYDEVRHIYFEQKGTSILIR